LVLGIEDGGDGIACDQGAWADAKVTLVDGSVVWVGDLPIIAGQEPPALATALPFSFTYDGRASADFLGAWTSHREDVDLDGARHKTMLAWTDPATRLEVRCDVVQYRDFPVAEWVLHFANRGEQDTPILEGIEAIDTAFHRRPIERPPLGEFILHRNRGDDLNVHNYEPSAQVVGPNETVRIAAVNGRPTQYVFPYFNLEWQSEGVIAVLGWPGQWAAEFAREGETGLRVRGGQEIVRARLRPGEEIRSPLAVLLFWKGDAVHAQNVWRAWMRDHNLPKPGGKPLGSQWNANLLGQTMEKSDAASQMRFIDGYAAHDLKIDYWWMDAGWYEGSHEHGWPHVGTWQVERTRFPGGLREVSERAHSHGMKSLVWFEPERVVAGTWLWEEHPEWLLGTDGGTRLLNLGHPEARAWVTQHIGDLIESEGIDLYRQDYNIDPLGFWRQGEPQDRQGITENHYVTGYLAFWDALLDRFPALVIDSCASGGRRNDLETMRRSIPKHRSDYIFEPTSQQCMTYALSSWFPIHGSGTLSMDRYELWSTEAPSNTTAWDVTNPDLPYDELRRFGEEFRLVAALQIEGDF
ncbi:MAG TPA: alpha-galactosidase, partial [Armatimonadota bacterium]|nr:alpha-galactosidase [Armatimonadota bacterium]